MIELLKNLTNREIASLFYIWIFLLFILIHNGVRKSLFQALLWMWWFKFPLLLTVIFISINIFIVNLFLWKYDILKEIIIWCFVVPFPLLLGANKIKENISYFKNTIKANLSFTVLITFIVSTYTFSVWFEIILLFLVLIFTLISAFSEIKKENKQVKNFSDYVLIFLFLIMLNWAIKGFTNEPDKLLAIKNLYTFFIPVILTILFFPFIYFFTLIMEYEVFLLRVKVFPNEKFSKYKIFLYIFKFCNFNLYKLSSFFKFYMQRRTWWTEEYFLEVIDEFKKLN